MLTFLITHAVIVLTVYIDHKIRGENSIFSSVWNILTFAFQLREGKVSMNSIETILKAIAPILSPLIVQAWESQLKPLIQAEIAKLSADEQIAANAFLVAVDSIIVAEAPKL